MSVGKNHRTKLIVQNLITFNKSINRCIYTLHIHVCMYVYVGKYIYMYIYMYVCMYVYY